MKNKIQLTLHPFSFLESSDWINSLIVLFFLLPQIAMLIFTKSWGSLQVLMAATAGSVGAEFFEKLYGKKKDSYSLVCSLIQGILTGLFLPSSLPVFAVFFTVFFVTVCVRYFIGSFADCWVNVPCLCVCLCWILQTALFPQWLLSHQVILARNPALQLIQNGSFPMISMDTRITAFFNKTVFSIFGVSIPDGYVSLFWDTGSLIPAFRFNLITLVSSIILISLNVVKSMIPGIFLLTYGLLVFFACPYLYASSGHGDLLLAFCTSGLLFSALFLLQYAGTVPMTVFGKGIYGFLAGVVALFVIGTGTSPAVSVVTVLLMNTFSLLIQHVEPYWE